MLCTSTGTHSAVRVDEVDTTERTTAMFSTTSHAATNHATTSHAATSPTSRRRLGRAGFLLASGLAATTLALTPTATSVAADTPPAPQGQTTIAADVNVHSISHVAIDAGDTWADTTFRSTGKFATVSWSTQPPTTSGGRWSMPGAQPQALTGAKQNGTFRFGFSRDGLVPARTYHALIEVHGAPGQPSNQFVRTVTTKTRHIRVTPVRIDIVKDGDRGVRGRGELHFGVRAVEDGALPQSAGFWGAFTEEHKLRDGDSVTLDGKGHEYVTTTRHNLAIIQVQAYEDDRDLFGDPCGIASLGMPAKLLKKKPSQASNTCWESAYATAYVTLPTGRYEGVQVRTGVATPSGTSSVRISAGVRVEVWYS